VGERSQRALEREPADGDPIYVVYLDSGSFHWLYEILLAKTRSQVWLKPYQALVHRTLISFDEARRAVDGEVAPEAVSPSPRKRTIPRVMKKHARRQKP
jgi:hypothetical protein